MRASVDITNVCVLFLRSETLLFCACVHSARAKLLLCACAPLARLRAILAAITTILVKAHHASLSSLRKGLEIFASPCLRREREKMWIQVRTMDGRRSARVDSLSKLTSIEELRDRLVGEFGPSRSDRDCFTEGSR